MRKAELCAKLTKHCVGARFFDLAFATNVTFQAKNAEKSYVYWDIDFGGVLGGFWDGFGKPNSSIFALLVLFLTAIQVRQAW